MERTSKTNKYKKKGKKRIDNTHDAGESTHESCEYIIIITIICESLVAADNKIVYKPSANLHQ